MYIDNLGVVAISTNKYLLHELFSEVPLKGLVALATLSDLNTMNSDLHYLKPEIIIIDDSFEEAGASKIVQKLRISEHCRELSRSVIVVITDNSSSEYHSFCYSCGVDYCMVKPIMGDILWARLESLIEMRVNEQSGHANELNQIQSLQDLRLKRLTALLLYSLGYSPKNRGFSYLWYGIVSIANHSVNLSVQGSDLYSVIGTRHNQNGMNVRHSIHDMLAKTDKEAIKKYMKKYNLNNAFGDGSELLASGIKFAHFAAYVVTAQLTERENDKNEKSKHKRTHTDSGS